MNLTRWERLPVDIFLIIFGKYLSVEDILNVRRTSRFFLSITRLHSLWYSLLHAQVLEKNIPIPGLLDRPINTLSTRELERLTQIAVRLRRNWSSPAPDPTRQIVLRGSGSQLRTLALKFLHGRGHRWLLSVDVSQDQSVPQHYTVRCWDIAISPPGCVARRKLRVLKSFAVNTDRTNQGVIALQCPHAEIWGINFSATNPDSAFVKVGSFQSRTEEILIFSGSRILAKESNLRYVIWDFHHPNHQIELHNPKNPQRGDLLTAIITEEVAILFRSSTVEIYPLTSLRAGVVAGTATHPIAQHSWPWRVDNVCVAEQFRWPQTQGRQRATINVLIRFRSWFPWPVNLLHHYVLRPNKSYLPSKRVNTNNIPYSKPVFMQSIASPVRLHAPSPMVLGLHGTALWVDSHTEDYFGDSGHGQRLTGRILSDTEPHNDIEPSVHMPSNEMASIVFRVQEHDGWTRLAIDEGEGRVAVGAEAGAITLLEYARR